MPPACYDTTTPRLAANDPERRHRTTLSNRPSETGKWIMGDWIMPECFSFLRLYAQYGADIRDFEKDEEVSLVLGVVMSEFAYPVSSLIGAKLSSQWLRAGDPSLQDASVMDIMFEMQQSGFVEIIMRDPSGAAFYGGWLERGNTYRVTNELVCGYRIIESNKADGTVRRHSYSERYGYQPVCDGLPVCAHTAQRLSQQHGR